MSTQYPVSPISQLPINQLIEQFDLTLAGFSQAREASREASNAEVLMAALPLLAGNEGLDLLYARVADIESAGVFTNGDWGKPEILQPGLAVRTLREGNPAYTAIEALSEIRMLAVASNDYFHPRMSSERARKFLTQVMALNLDLLGQMSEADRERPENLGPRVQTLYQYLLNHLGYESILESLVGEVGRMLAQRPVETGSIKKMIGQIAKCLFDPKIDTEGMHSAARLVSALFGPTKGCQEDPGLEVYEKRLAAMDHATLTKEAAEFDRAMHSTGLVSPYHPVFLRYLRKHCNELIPFALGLSTTGNDALQCYPELVYRLIDDAIYPETCQAIYGLAMLLERGALFSTPVVAGLWRQIALKLSKETAESLQAAFGHARPPQVFLLAGVLTLIGQPLGVGQGNNPTCQSVIWLSMWAGNDADYLLQLVAWAARDNEILTRFEGEQISSKGLAPGLAKEPPLDVDAVSLILVPHLRRNVALVR